MAFNAGYSYIDNEQDGTYLPYVPKHKANAGLIISYRNFKAGLDGEYVKGLYADTQGVKEFDSYLVANASLSYTIMEKYTAFINLYNITNKDYATFAVIVPPLGNSYCEYPMPGFHFLAGLKATF